MSAIIIPSTGGPRDGLDPINSMPKWASDKLDIAIKMHQLYKTIPIILLSSRTCCKPPTLDINGNPVQECSAMALYLQYKGVDMNYVFEENASYDTIGNAFFLRLIHTDINKLYNLYIIVNEFHHKRVEAIFDWIFMKNSQDCKYTLNYIMCSDNIIDSNILKARIQKEVISLKNIQNTIANLQIDSFQDIYKWIFSEHRLYASKYKYEQIMIKKHTIDNALLQSY